MAYFAYTRVSTIRQGQFGVSLQEQRAAISQFAERHGLQIAQWFEETETAAKVGRKVFKDMVRRAGRGEVRGLILHKIDRGARNLRDWADIGDLIDQGVDVRFAHDDLRLDSRGGRLAADIQAVIAADYIRNLREEVKKGFYGRLHQGLLPLPAPTGYVNRGSGKLKMPHPVYAHAVRLAFEWYASGDHTLSTISESLAGLGILNERGKPFSVSNLSYMLHNPFYAGTIRLPSTGEIFKGAHEPLVSQTLFDQVQEQFVSLRGRRERRRHTFAYSLLVRCTCGRHLIGELKKGRYQYYRCHRCRGVCIREEKLDELVTAVLPQALDYRSPSERLRTDASSIVFDGFGVKLMSFLNESEQTHASARPITPHSSP